MVTSSDFSPFFSQDNSHQRQKDYDKFICITFEKVCEQIRHGHHVVFLLGDHAEENEVEDTIFGEELHVDNFFMPGPHGSGMILTSKDRKTNN